MYEFFSIVDATHDDGTVFPTLSAPHDTFPFEWEAEDGGEPQSFTTKAVVVSQRSGSGWTQLKRTKDVTFTVVVTQGRTVIFCEKFTKGGRWVGFGAGGLAFALVANAVSHARAAARRRGKLLVGQVRHEWLVGVGILTDKQGRPTAVRLVVDAGTADRPRVLALDLALKQRHRPDAWAAAIAAAAARHRLQHPELSGHDDLRRIANGQAGQTPLTLAGSVPVGARRSARQLDTPIAETETAEEPATPTDTALQAGCPACGAPLSDPSRSCGRCGHAPAAPRPAPAQSPDEDPVNRTTLRGATPLTAMSSESAEKPEPGEEDTHLVPDVQPIMPSPPSTGAAATAADPSATSPVSPPPPPTSKRAVEPGSRHGGPAPAEVWAVSAGLLVLAAFALYPVLRYLFPVVGDLFTTNDLARAFAALILEYAVILTATGLALVLLAVGLIRGSRVSQVLTCLLAGLVALGQAIESQQHGFGAPSVSTGAAVASFAIALVVIGLAAGTPNARRFFAADRRPVGIVIGGLSGAFLGGIAVLDGVLLMLAGSLAHRYLWLGVVFAVIGVTLIASGAPLRHGSTVARAALVTAMAAFSIVLFVLASQLNDIGSASTLIPVGLCSAAVIGVTGPRASRAHFARRAPSAPASPRRVSATSTVAAGAAAALVVVMAIVAFSSAGGNAEPVSEPSAPDFASSTDTGFANSSGITRAGAQSFAPSVMTALEGNGTADVCNGGDLPSIDVYDYRIQDVTPDTAGAFRVSANVSLSDGTYETVSYLVTDDGSGSACADPTSFTTQGYSPGGTSSGGQPSPAPAPSPSPSVPTDVPSVPSTGDPVPTDAPLPSAPTGSVVAYTSDTTPTNSSEIVEYQPDGLDADQTAAVQTVIAFMTYINQQHFQAAWHISTYSLRGSAATSNFRQGYATSRFYQVEFGQPETLAGDLIVVPGRFVSKQDPSAQGNPSGVTPCSYWPQYMFTVTRAGGRWLIDSSGREAGRSELDALKRQGAGGLYLNPVAQREDCS